ncbi:MAG: hypothetical protein NTZ78_07180 [Candidatus Aureabacteria bacterium]|nr:hypothetical protein [Candidatus Auribacterota bacterium]
MAKSIVKRTLAAGALIVLCAIVALGIYVYPRRLVPSLVDTIPSERVIACARVCGLAPVWKGCVRSAFGRRIFDGDISPIREKRAADERFKKRWEMLRAPYWSELFGRDCILALYNDGEGKNMRVAVWSRVGFKTRLFHLLLHLWNAWRPPEEKRLRSWREGSMTVTEITDRKRGTPVLSYALLGDLCIATQGSSVEFWKGVDGLIKGKDRRAHPLLHIGETSEGGRGATGGFFVDVDELRAYIGTRFHGSLGGGAEGKALVRDLWEYAQEAAEGWKHLEGTLTLAGSRLDAAISIIETAVDSGSGSAGLKRDPSTDPLASLMDRKGLFYAGGRSDLRARLSQFRTARAIEKVEFLRPREPAVFPADHFSLSWMGDDFSILLYEDSRGMVNAAASLLTTDPAQAKERIARFLKLANGAKVRLIDKSGGQLDLVKEPIELKAKRLGKEVYYRIGGGDLLEALYTPIICMRGDRVVVATTDSVLGDLAQGKKLPPGAWREAAGAAIVLRGNELARTAASLRQVLMLAAPFVERKSERQLLMSATQALGFLEWLTPVQEGWATATREGKDIRVRCHSQFADLSEP